mmetsp:Transcript_17389/g.55034  ORF Transcript_17389/g.55034 Transcript_17389/m.55034 type:complete len:250 (-) Transcript_17389:359-1108(-)
MGQATATSRESRSQSLATSGADVPFPQGYFSATSAARPAPRSSSSLALKAGQSTGQGLVRAGPVPEPSSQGGAQTVSSEVLPNSSSGAPDSWGSAARGSSAGSAARSAPSTEGRRPNQGPRTRDSAGRPRRQPSVALPPPHPRDAAQAAEMPAASAGDRGKPLPAAATMQLPDPAATLRKRPFAAGMCRRKLMEMLPELSPATVTCAGLPPNAWMFCCTHFKARTWSPMAFMPPLDGKPASSAASAWEA